mmetsp:Transcript_18731/g.46373  ORF Transcript_18731/g.46373 Transcript_18731/m.46373 type:complete len:705 (-) Transcript_18731:311-2425(-)|eukprot:CAMPEP_0113618876 /NCGR_PEP_ID=MMETSP0017_2-20120614/9574_1 /TAXON_ID=2856 /ORGANISM="Cylindrotheca closterium" /LENGTH=704 /DNA_ID=CAMNT_0000528421 /DNA_START=100 /DNA_END=2214 /DNA_ORIENTATION=- /assembly_acc=CAM_ASM_000147
MYATTTIARLTQRRTCAVRSAFTASQYQQLRTLASWNGVGVGGDNNNVSRTSKPAVVSRDRFFKTNYKGKTGLEQTKIARFKSTFKPSTSAATTPAIVIRKDDDKEEATVTVQDNGKSYLLDFGLPKLIPEWRKMFSAETLFQDVSAGLTVGCIAVPLSLAIAVASGVPAEVGLVTAAVSGIAGGLMGGTTLAVTGPAAAISLLVVGAVEQHGLEALPFITMACGGMQLASGVTRLGVVAKLVPVSVIAGFTTGVGTLILTGQIPKALGMATPAGLNPLEVLSYVGEHASAINPSSAALAVGTSAAMFLLPKIHAKIPSALLAVGGATLATHGLGLDVALIGAIPSGLSAFQFGIPHLPAVDSLPSLAATTFLIYSMTSVESLLSCAALEKMKKTSYKHSPDQELVGQGLANMGSALFMGMPVTSVIARSGLNLRLNAATRLPALVQAGFVFSSVVFFSDKIAMIPMPALSGMLITTGMGMLNPAEFKHCYAVQKMDTLPFLTTIGGMVSMGLAEGIGIGCVTALALNYQQASMVPGSASMLPPLSSTMMSAMPVASVHHAMSPLSSSHQEHPHTIGISTPVTSFTDANGEKFLLDADKSSVLQLNGPINFVSMFAIDNMVRDLQERVSAAAASGERYVVVDMEKVTNLEFTGMEELATRLIEVADGNEDVTIQMVNCSDLVYQALDQCDPKQQIQRFATLTAV